jgi:Tfp pilus assembly protein PilF
MSVVLLAAIALSPTPPAAVAVPTETARVDVGYDALVKGNAEEALSRIEANRNLAIDDPAALINAGAAYARLGRDAEARESFRAAMSSRKHYYLELADGRWMDSREAARLAMRQFNFAER